MPDFPGAQALLMDALGVPFLSFVLNADREAVSQRLLSGTTLAAPQEQVLGELLSFVDQVGRAPASADDFSLYFELSALAQHDKATDVSWSVAARMRAGGAIELPEATDELSRLAVGIARDMYPLFLLPRSGDVRLWQLGPSVSRPLFAHPHRAALEEAVMKDEVLARLFPDESSQSGRHGSMYRSTGSGGGLQLWMFAETLLKNSWLFATQHEPTAPVGDFARAVMRLLSVMREVLGGPVTIPALLGITGVRLPAGATVSLPWGTLREVRENDRRWIPPGLGGNLTTTTPDGAQVVIDYAGDIVLELNVPYRVKCGQVDIAAGWPLEIVSAEHLERCLETLRLSMLLAGTREPVPIVVGTWQAFLDPFQTGLGVSWRDPRRIVSLTPTALTSEEAKEWEKWTRLVDEKRTKSIDIAIRRALQASAERTDPTDALVDAVIAWENLAGSSEGEPTLRVSAAMAWLLGADADDRVQVRQRVAKLYDLRSKVVHGNRTLEPRVADQQRRDAIELTVRALRRLFQDRPELLSECRDSSERSLRLILDA